MTDLTKTAAYSNKTPYDLWQESEGIPVVSGHCVEDLSAIPVAPMANNLINVRRDSDVSDMCTSAAF